MVEDAPPILVDGCIVSDDSCVCPASAFVRQILRHGKFSSQSWAAVGCIVAFRKFGLADLGFREFGLADLGFSLPHTDR